MSYDFENIATKIHHYGPDFPSGELQHYPEWPCEYCMAYAEHGGKRLGYYDPNDAIKAREPIKHEEWCKCECGAQGGESL